MQKPRSYLMRCTILGLWGGMLAPLAAASSDVEAAIRALTMLGAENEKLQQYCAIVPATPVTDPAVWEEIEIKLDNFFSTLGPEYEILTRIGNELPEGSKEEATLEAAFDELERGCGRI